MKLGSQSLNVSAHVRLLRRAQARARARARHDRARPPRRRRWRHLLDTSDFYGPHTNEALLGKALQDGVRDKVQLATKFGIVILGDKLDLGDPAYVRAACEASLKRLGIDCIDLYYQHRIDTTVPIEITVGELRKLVEEGKIKYIRLSEASASTIRRAHLHMPFILSPQFSLSGRYGLEMELGIGIVAYSPLGRGFLSSGAKLMASLPEHDRRKLSKQFPRFQQENLNKNAQIFECISAMATRKGCTASQLALAWVHHQGSDVCAIPGTTKMENFNKNVGALSVTLTAEDIGELESLVAAGDVQGDRYPQMANTWKHSETPSLASWKAESHLDSV
ncbi:hypothetical protein EJB05_37101, partial [Eragrostis curvula]